MLKKTGSLFKTIILGPLILKMKSIKSIYVCILLAAIAFGSLNASAQSSQHYGDPAWVDGRFVFTQQDQSRSEPPLRSTHNASARPVSNSFENQVVNLAEQNRIKALNFLSIAISKISMDSFKEYLRRIYNELDQANLQLAADEACSGEKNFDTAAYAEDSKIFLCPVYAELVPRYRINPNSLISTLIHEAVHLAGEQNECAADSLAAEVMSLNGIHLKDAGYGETCKNY